MVNINEKPNETWEDCEKELDTLFKESLGIEEKVVTERAHKAKTDKSKKSNTYIGGKGGLSIFAHKEGDFKPRTDLSINSNNVEPFCIETHHKKDKNIFFNVMYSPPKSNMKVFGNLKILKFSENFCGNMLSENDEGSIPQKMIW